MATLNVEELRRNLWVAHNKLRKRHSSPHLEYSKNVESTAQKWAVVLARACLLNYSLANEKYGENIIEFRSFEDVKDLGSEIANTWYSQNRFFDYETFDHSGPVDQFTQMIWANSKSIGIGVAMSFDRRLYVVVHYSPPGALIDQVHKNIRPPGNYSRPNPLTGLGKSNIASEHMKMYLKKDEVRHFQEDALNKINFFRIIHGSLSLKLNETFCKSATLHAQRCATHQKLLKDEDFTCGITYLELFNPDRSITGGLAPRYWYAEMVGYDYTAEPVNNQYHNFTQLVWNSTKEVGIGVAATRQGRFYIIGHFFPPGNVKDLFLVNIAKQINAHIGCTCGCGYPIPACKEDLNLVILYKLPLHMDILSHVSDRTYGPRTYSTYSKIWKEFIAEKPSDATKPYTIDRLQSPKIGILNESPSKRRSFSLNLVPFGNEMKSKSQSQIRSKVSISPQELNIDVENLKIRFFNIHNKYRKLHGSPLLIYSSNLEITAKKWASTLADKCVFAYSLNNPHYSENCAEVIDIGQIKGVVDNWYSQESNYDYIDLKHAGYIDKFGIMIWRSINSVGFGISVSQDKRIYVVAHYSPPGLQYNKFRESIQPRKDYEPLERNLKPYSPKEVSSKRYRTITKKDRKIFEGLTFKEINNFRYEHYSPSLTLSKTLCKVALHQATYCAVNERLLFLNQNQYGVTYLELIIQDLSLTGNVAVRHWYAESLGYNYKTEPTTPQYNNFTQLVWKSSKNLGIGLATSGNGILYVIGIFTPSGNICNEYINNVLSPRSKDNINLCCCGCGYVTPACSQDFQITILSKFPDNYTNSPKEFLTYVPRSYSVYVKHEVSSTTKRKTTIVKSDLPPKVSLKNDFNKLEDNNPDRRSTLLELYPIEDLLPRVSEKVQNNLLRNIQPHVISPAPRQVFNPTNVIKELPAKNVDNKPQGRNGIESKVKQKNEDIARENVVGKNDGKYFALPHRTNTSDTLFYLSDSIFKSSYSK